MAIIEKNLEKPVVNRIMKNSFPYNRSKAPLCEIRDLIKNGLDVNFQDQYQNSLLHGAIIDGRPDLARFLIEKGADVNTRNSSGSTALLLACERFMPEIIKLLIDRGADLNAYDNRRLCCLYYLANVRLKKGMIYRAEGVSERGENSVVFARSTVKEDDVRRLINRKKPGGVKFEKTEVGGERGDPNEIIGIFIKKGAKLDVEDKHGWRPLHQMAAKGNLEAVKMMVEAGADLYGRDRLYNRRPLDVARQEKRNEIADYLESEMSLIGTIGRIFKGLGS